MGPHAFLNWGVFKNGIQIRSPKSEVRSQKTMMRHLPVTFLLKALMIGSSILILIGFGYMFKEMFQDSQSLYLSAEEFDANVVQIIEDTRAMKKRVIELTIKLENINIPNIQKRQLSSKMSSLLESANVALRHVTILTKYIGGNFDPLESHEHSEPLWEDDFQIGKKSQLLNHDLHRVHDKMIESLPPLLNWTESRQLSKISKAKMIDYALMNQRRKGRTIDYRHVYTNYSSRGSYYIYDHSLDDPCRVCRAYASLSILSRTSHFIDSLHFFEVQ